MWKLKLVLFGALLGAEIAHADLPDPPSLKPQVAYASTVVSTQDAATFREALAAADRKDWSALRRLMRQARSTPVSEFILWRLATGAQTTAGFDILNQAMTDLPDWPRARSIQIYAEEAIAASALSHTERVNWFERRGAPISGQGKIAYADALRRSGQGDRAFGLVRDAWRNNALNRAIQNEVLQRYGDQLTQSDHEARVNYLLWGRQTTAASRLRSRVSPSYRAVMDARVALITRGRGVDSKVGGSACCSKKRSRLTL